MTQSGQQIGKDNVTKFNIWVAEREAAADWHDYLRHGKLNRSEIAAECQFALSVLRQNPAVQQALRKLEDDLEARGIIPRRDNSLGNSHEAEEASIKVAEGRVFAAKARVEARVKELAERNAALEAEVADLRAKLRRFEHVDAHLSRTGRLLPT